MRKVSDHMRLVKREAGANPARTRHRDSQATAYYHWETGKGVEASERSVGRPAFRSTGMKSYRSPGDIRKTRVFDALRCFAAHFCLQNGTSER